MAILVDENTRLLEQGITGHAGEFRCTMMIAYGTDLVSGVTPGKGGQLACEEQYDPGERPSAEKKGSG